MANERKVLLLLILLAAARVFLFAAAFPFFNNVDEQRHVDSVVRRSHGEFPHHLSPISDEAAGFIAYYGTWEYLNKPERFEGGKYPPPIWTMPADEGAAFRSELTEEWRTRLNFEIKEPPLYYVAAGLWLKFGRALALNGGVLLYWIRFLNVFVVAAVVWLAYETARVVFPSNAFIRISVTLLAAIWPQDIFYSIQADVLSPVCGGVGFLALCCWMRDASVGFRYALLAGLALGCACLNKLANVPFAIVGVCAAFALSWLSIRRGEAKRALVDLAIFLGAKAGPFAAWCWWNYRGTGELTGTAEKVRHLGWTAKSLSQWWPHPIFSAGGVWFFWADLMARFWRGELVWQGDVLAFRAVDLLYVISSSALLLIAIIAFSWRRRQMSAIQRRALPLALAWLAAAIGFLIVLSLAFQFTPSSYPSSDFPYFTPGRIVTAVIIPFLLLYAYGLDTLTSGLRAQWRWIILSVIAIAITVPEIILNAPVFRSPFNFFHIIQAGV